MSRTILHRTVAAAALVGAIAAVWAVAPASGGTATRVVVSSGTTSLRDGPTDVDGLQAPEVDPAAVLADGSPVVNRARPGFKNGKFPKNPLDAPTVASAVLAATNPELGLSFNGLNFRQQRLANGGNQFSVEPPDQGLCVGNGFVLETVNDVLNVYSTSGQSLLGVTDLNTFYGYPAEINRTTGVFGPFLTDPSCYFDQPTQRWFHIALTFDVFPSNGGLTGTNHLDIAVSQTSDPP